MKNTNIRFWLPAFVCLALGLQACSPGSLYSILGTDGGGPLTESEVANGLKQALAVGADSAVARVTKADGFFRDAAIRILLPPEAQQVIDRLNSTGTGRVIYQNTIAPVVDDLVRGLNRSAEDAAKKAGPIFTGAITSMTVRDAFGILNGADTSATAYLRGRTYEQLVAAFQPNISASLDKTLVGRESTNSLWTKFANTYNDVRRTPANLLLNLPPMAESNLSAYVTRRGMDGLFVKVAEEERQIRKDPAARVTGLLKKVFGSLDRR